MMNELITTKVLRFKTNKYTKIASTARKEFICHWDYSSYSSFESQASQLDSTSYPGETGNPR